MQTWERTRTQTWEWTRTHIWEWTRTRIWEWTRTQTWEWTRTRIWEWTWTRIWEWTWTQTCFLSYGPIFLHTCTPHECHITVNLFQEIHQRQVSTQFGRYEAIEYILSAAIIYVLIIYVWCWRVYERDWPAWICLRAHALDEFCRVFFVEMTA